MVPGREEAGQGPSLGMKILRSVLTADTSQFHSVDGYYRLPGASLALERVVEAMTSAFKECRVRKGNKINPQNVSYPRQHWVCDFEEWEERHR